MGSKTVSFWFTWPPSVNRSRVQAKNHNRLINTKVLRDWQSGNDLSNRFRRSQAFGKARLSVTLILYPPDKRKRDIDNFTKCVIDQMQKFEVFEDDSQIDRLRVIREEVNRGGKIFATVTEI